MRIQYHAQTLGAIKVISKIRIAHKKANRDVSESLQQLATSNPKLKTALNLPLNKIFRGGSIDYASPDQIRHPRTIVNLKMGPDNMYNPIFAVEQAKYVQLAVDNSIDKYHTHLKEVRQWLNDILLLLQSLEQDKFPVLFHCRAGKDRTGVAVAAILLALGYPKDVVAQEFLLSPEVKAEDIENIMAVRPSLLFWVIPTWLNFRSKPIIKGPPQKYFNKVNLSKLKANLGVS